MVRLIYIAAIPVPLFIHPELFIGATASGVKIHWIVIFAPLLLIYVRTIPWTIVGLAAIFVVAFLIGLSEDGNWLRGVYLVQTLVPIAGYFAAIRHETAFRVIVASATLSTLAILALAVSYGAPSEEASVRLAAAIPQFRSYYPFIVVTAIACAAALLNTQRSRAEAIALVVSIAVLVISFALAWSRTGLVMLAIVAVAPILMRRSAFNVALSASIVAGAVVVVMSFSVLADRFTPANYERAVEQSDQNRLNYAIEAVERVVASPLTGSGFEPSRTERYGEAYAVPRQFPAHNQYIDYAVRGGLPALAMLIIIMAWVARTLWRRLFSEAHPYIVAIGAVLLAAAVGGMTQLFMVQAMTGSLVWLMIALAREPYR